MRVFCTSADLNYYCRGLPTAKLQQNVCFLLSGVAEINQNIPVTLFDKFHRTVNLLKFQKPMQLLVRITIAHCIILTMCFLKSFE